MVSKTNQLNLCFLVRRYVVPRSDRNVHCSQGEGRKRRVYLPFQESMCHMQPKEWQILNDLSLAANKGVKGTPLILNALLKERLLTRARQLFFYHNEFKSLPA